MDRNAVSVNTDQGRTSANQVVIKDILIVGGGTAGWITAGYLARMLATDTGGGIGITLVESPDIGAIGVGEGTFPSIRKTLSRIGIDEVRLFTEAAATFKQGIRFDDWAGAGHRYYHLFQPAARPEGLDLLPYWLLGGADDRPWSAVCNVQSRVVDARLGPKQARHEPWGGPLAYAYHFDAVAFAGILRRHAVSQGVRHIQDKVTEVRQAPDGNIDLLRTEAHGDLRADLYVDCTGFQAQLIGGAMKVPFVSRQHELFTDRAVTAQIPWGDPMAPLPSCTLSSARSAGWIWDIGLSTRRGVGYVYSSDHCDDETAARELRRYTGVGDDFPLRRLDFEAGYRLQQWRGNCVAIGLSAGFMEPLEATGIGFAESASLVMAALFPWGGDLETAAKQFNAIMTRRYANVVEFIKAHYCLSSRRDSDFWIDNCRPETIPDALKDRLDRWKHRMPDFIDIDYGHDTFVEENWRQVIYGMGFKSDLSARRGALRYFDDARRAFAAIDQQAEKALGYFPDHRQLVEALRSSGATEGHANVEAAR